MNPQYCRLRFRIELCLDVESLWYDRQTEMLTDPKLAKAPRQNESLHCRLVFRTVLYFNVKATCYGR